MHSWSTRRTHLRLSLLQPRSALLPTRQKRCPTSITYEDEVDRRVFAHLAQSLSEKTSTTGCSACRLYTTKHLGLLLKNRTRRLRACMFLVFGCCIRLASSFTSNCSLHLSSLKQLAHLPRLVASSILQHQAPCHFLHQSFAHEEYSQLCSRGSIPSVTPEFRRVEGRRRAPIRSPPFAPGGYSLNSLFKLIASSKSPISTLIAACHVRFPVSNTDAELSQ